MNFNVPSQVHISVNLVAYSSTLKLNEMYLKAGLGTLHFLVAKVFILVFIFAYEDIK